MSGKHLQPNQVRHFGIIRVVDASDGARNVKPSVDKNRGSLSIVPPIQRKPHTAVISV